MSGQSNRGLILLTIGACLLFAGCGKRGNVEPPQGKAPPAPIWEKQAPSTPDQPKAN